MMALGEAAMFVSSFDQRIFYQTCTKAVGR
jgi:hypothetical protein